MSANSPIIWSGNDARLLPHGTLRKADGTAFLTSGGGGNSFTTIQTITGTSPVAASSADTLTLNSPNGSLSIIGNSGTDTVSFDVIHTVVTKTSDYTVLVGDDGKTLLMNSTSQHTFNLPTSPAVGMRVTLGKVNTGKLILQAPASTVIIDSSAAGTCYNDSTNEVFATLTLEYVKTNLWTAVGGLGTWTTT